MDQPLYVWWWSVDGLCTTMRPLDGGILLLFNHPCFSMSYAEPEAFHLVQQGGMIVTLKEEEPWKCSTSLVQFSSWCALKVISNHGKMSSMVNIPSLTYFCIETWPNFLNFSPSTPLPLLSYFISIGCVTCHNQSYDNTFASWIRRHLDEVMRVRLVVERLLAVEAMGLSVVSLRFISSPLCQLGDMNILYAP